MRSVPWSLHAELSHVMEAVWMKFANGQNPSCKPLQMDVTSGWFGCASSSFSKQSTLIGVTILKGEDET